MTAAPDLSTETPVADSLVEGALRQVHLTGAILLRGEFAAPWALEPMGPEEYVAALCPGAQGLVLFHVVLEGSCRIRLESGEEALVSAGEAVMLPYADRHVMSDPQGASPVPVAQLLPPQPWNGGVIRRQGGEGPRTRILCGYLSSGNLLFRPVFRALPPLNHFRPASAAAAEWLCASARYALDEAGLRTGFAARLPELLLIDCLRQYIRKLPPGRSGWLGALRDPVVGRALSLLHQAPAQAWTVAALARRVGVSRTVLGDRFATALGSPPMRYLMDWRLQLASHELRSSDATLPEIAARVGYRSEAAFGRAFKRSVGQSPAGWRRTLGPARAQRPRAR